MDSHTTQITEYHSNGQLFFTETRCLTPPLFDHQYDCRIAPDGTPWHRVGLMQKWYDNGQLAWTLEFDEFGRETGKNWPQFRKDGAVIQY